jgi:hypothetical protein
MYLLFEIIVNGIVIYSFLFYLLLVYRKVTDFCKLILYPATLLKLLMVSRSIGEEFFWVLRYRIMSSANRDILTVSLLICIPFIYSCLIALARNSKTMLNRSGEGGHHPDFRRNGFILSPINYVVGDRFIPS